MKYSVVNLNNKKVSDIDLKDSIFGIEPNQQCIYDAIKNVLANKRQGTASSLTRSEVSGSTKKPWKQKGTGRARVGTKRTPLWKGGGIIFGPAPRDYSYSIPKKIREKAYSSVFSQFVKDNKMIVVEDLELKTYKTKEVIVILKALTSVKKVMFVVNKRDTEGYKNLRLATKNIPWLKTTSVDSVEIKDLFYANEVLIEKSALEKFNGRYKNEY